MKKIYKSVFIALFGALCVSSCDNYEAPEITSEPAITIVSRETNFPARQSSGIIKFKAEGTVTVSTENSWLSASIQGDEILVSCTQNNSLESRSGLITVKNGQKTTDISIIQEGLMFQLLNAGDLTVSAMTQTIEFDVRTNVDAQVTSSVNWMKGSIEGDILSISVDENASLNQRDAVLTVIYGDNSSSIKVTQDGISLELFDVEEWVIPSTTSSSMSYSFPYNFTVNFSTAQSDWLSFSQSNGMLTITAAANNTGHIRNGSFTFALGDKQGTVKVKQCSVGDILGSYTAHYYTGSSKATEREIATTLRQSGTLYYMDITSGGVTVSVPFTWDDSTRTLTIKNGQYCGMNGSNYVYTCFGYINASGGASYTHASNTTYCVQGTPTYDDSTQTTMIQLEDCGINSGFEIAYLRLTNYSSNTTFSTSTQVSAFLSMYYPWLVSVN